jgi:GTP pyrophosphokinase
MPKNNMYQSLHTTVIGPSGHMVEFQIRTWQMHHVAEEGVAAHWKYKEGKPFNVETDTRFFWLKQLLEQKNTAGELVESLKEDLLPEQIFVFTPGGDVVELPQGSTPIDFAYYIHSEIGNRIISAKINGKIVQLKYNLVNGDKVEIITNSTQEPRKAWLSIVKTSRAKSRINSFLRKKESDKAIAKATTALDKELKLRGSSFKELLDNEQELKKLLEKLSLRDKDDLLMAVGFERVTAQKVANVLFPDINPPTAPAERTEPKKQLERGEPFQVEGIDNVVMRIARCCNPLPGDEVVGYISSGRGITVHKKNCSNVTNIVNSTRVVPVVWKQGSAIVVNIWAATVSRPGLIHDITKITKDLKVNIAGYTAVQIGVGRSEQRFSVEIDEKSKLEELLAKISRISGVNSVKIAPSKN